MIPALLYAYGEYVGAPLITIDRMVALHGMVNAFGFALCGALGWLLVKPKPRYETGIPFSRLRGRGRIGADFFERHHLTASGSIQGLVDSMSVFASADFDPDVLSPAIRDFYERTARYELVVDPAWQRGFFTAARLFKRLSVAVQQMNFPLARESGETLMESRIIPLNDQEDGRTGVRAWVRQFVDTRLPIYAAAYSTHTYRGRTYMNIAFPLPYCNLTSILRLYRDGEELVLTSLSGREKGDEGVYLVTPLMPLRLPINETIRVRSVDRGADHGPEVPPNVTVHARHDMWLFGIRFLTLTYWIYPVR